VEEWEPGRRLYVQTVRMLRNADTLFARADEVIE